MDVDLDERRGLTGCDGGVLDAEALQFDEANHTGLSRRQSGKQIVHHDGAYHGMLVILDRYLITEGENRYPRGASNVVDPLVACDRRDPRPKRSRRRVRVRLGKYGEKCLLPRIFRGGTGKPPRVIAAQPGI